MKKKTFYDCMLKQAQTDKMPAFTLAEVLITLTIIGVIAALTIPTLFNNIQKSTALSGVLKAQSMLSNLFTQAPLKYNCQSGDFECLEREINSQYTRSERAKAGGPYGLLFQKQLHTVKTLTSKECFDTEYYTVSRGVKTKTTTNDSSSELSCAVSHILNNGMLISASSYSITGSLDSTVLRIIVDINGNKKGPNTTGRDVFAFEILTRNAVAGVNPGIIFPVGSKTFYKSRSMWYTGNPKNPCASDELTTLCTGKLIEEKKMNY